MRKHTILVVEDDRQVRNMLKAIMEHAGYAVDVADDGAEGMLRIRERLPDLVLLDIDMPRINGYQICQSIKSDPRTRLLPVVFLTGRDRSDDRLQAWGMDADDFLTKPFQSVEVVARCRALLRVKDLVDELDSAQSIVFSLARAMEAKSPPYAGPQRTGNGLCVDVGNPPRVVRCGLRRPGRRGGPLCWTSCAKSPCPDAILSASLRKNLTADGARRSSSSIP